MDFSILGYQFIQNAILAAFLAGIACSIIGVFVVTMHLSFIGICMSHAAFAGALFGLWIGFNPILCALLFCLLAAAIVGPLADRGELNPDTSIGVVFTIMMGLAFLFIGLMTGPKSEALNLLWGSILTIGHQDLVFLSIIAALVVGLVVFFYKEIQAVIFHREIALAVGIPASLFFYGLLFLSGATITASLQSIGGLLIFALIINPAAAAYQLTYSLKKMFLLSALFGVLSGWIGLWISYLFDLPSGATIVIISAVIFGVSILFSPKRKVKRWQEQENERTSGIFQPSS